MHLNFELKRRFAQLSVYLFVVISNVSQMSFIFVSSADVQAIPLSLYQTKFLEPSQLHYNTLEENLEDSYNKRGSHTAFYGLRGKRPLDSFETIAEENKRSAFYPVRGKKPSTFTALRGRKDMNENIHGNDFSNRDSGQGEKRRNSTTEQLIKSKYNESHRDLSKENFIPDDNIHSHHINTDNNSPFPWNTLINTKGLPFDPTKDLNSKALDDGDDKFYDHIGAITYPEDAGEDVDDQMVHKRRSSGFIPMRGRKFSDLTESLPPSDKRKSSFIPMRGRRVTEGMEWRMSNKNSESDAQKKSMAFLPMRGRRSIFTQSRRNKLYSQRSRWPFLQGKRVAFHAVRGKKDSLAMDWDNPKRAFYASRGKKLDDYDSENSEDNSNYSDLFADDFAISEDQKMIPRIKRSLQGKMSKSKSRETVAIKRPMTFFASRGKRFGGNIQPEFSPSNSV